MMTHTIYNKLKTGVLCLLVCSATSLLVASCSDKWDEHYTVLETEQGSLWQAISNNPDLENFSRVLRECGYDQVLSGNQSFSVFAPTNAALTEKQTDSLIALFRQQHAAGTRINENSVIRQFVQNHITLYKHSVSSLTGDTIVLLNDKYARLTNQSLADCRLLSGNTLCSNGLLFTLDRQMAYFPNVFEYLGNDNDLDSVYQFLASYNNYEFDETKSVPGEIIDGLTHYLDSVSTLRNSVLSTYGLINSEDSTYWLVAPTNTEWNRLVAEYQPYFNYANNVARRDSLTYTNTRIAIMGGNFFSRTNNSDEALQDSAVSTQAYTPQMRSLLGITEAYYVYKQPKPFAEGGVFWDTEDIVCSNGHVRKAEHQNVSRFDTFLQTIKVEAEDLQYQDTLMNAVDPVTIHQVAASNPFYNKVSGNAFVEIAPINPTAKIIVGFKVPNVFSGVKYHIYAVFVPATASDPLAVAETEKANKVISRVRHLDQNGILNSPRFRYPMSNDAAKVDTVRLMSDVTFVTSSFGLSEPQVKLELQSNVQENEIDHFSTTMRLDCIIFRPSESTK